MTEPIGWHSRGYLPHYDDGKLIQAVTYRLADSLPTRVLERLDEQTADDAERRLAIEHYLDAGHGSCVLRSPDNAGAVLSTWQARHGHDYWLHAWIIMPNHVHVLVAPIENKSIRTIVSAWKSVSARQILGQTPDCADHLSAGAAEGGRAPGKRRVWQPDYYDRFIRNESHYLATVEYIHQNPVKAGLITKAEEWPWSSAGLWERGRPRPP